MVDLLEDRKGGWAGRKGRLEAQTRGRVAEGWSGGRGGTTSPFWHFFFFFSYSCLLRVIAYSVGVGGLLGEELGGGREGERRWEGFVSP